MSIVTPSAPGPPPARGILYYMASHPTAANLLMIIFLFLGATSISSLVRETFPEFDSSRVKITVAYPGATAEDVELAICERIEDVLDSVVGVKEVKSTAVEGMATVQVEMMDGFDISTFLADIKSEVEAINEFPDEAEDPNIREMNRTDMVLALAVTGPMNTPHLKLYAEDLKNRLLRLPGVAQVDIGGFSDHQIRIEVPARKLMQFGLSVSDITSRIADQSVNLPAGTVETEAGDVLVRFMDQRNTPLELEQLAVVSSKTGAEVLLGDIATITDRFETDEDKVLLGDKRAAMLVIEKNKGQDALDVLAQIETFMAQEEIAAPAGVKLTIVRNVTEIVSDRLTMLSNNGVQGLVLVFFVMWLFFSFRLSFWVAMGLPVSFFGAFWAMTYTGMTLNMLTMVGLLLALGLIMDDAIVIAENVSAHLARGRSALRAAVDGTREVGVGVFSSFATTVFIFGSIAVLIEGHIGKVLWVMPVVLMLTLVVSLVEAFFILPNHLSHSLKNRPKEPNRFRRWFGVHLENVRENRLGSAVDWAVKWRYLLAGLVLSSLLISVSMLAGGVVKFLAFPAVEGDTVVARVLLPQGTPLLRTEEVVGRITSAIDQVNREFKPLQPDGQDLVQSVVIQYNTNSDAGESGPHVASVYVDLLSAEERNALLDDVTGRLRELTTGMPDLISLTWKEPSLGPAGMAIDVQLYGDDLDQLKAASQELQAWLGEYQGVQDLFDDMRPGKPEIRATLKPGALGLGLTAQSIAGQLRAAYQGVTADEIQYGGESYDIDVRLSAQDQNSLADLEYFHVTTPGGEQVPLGSVATLREGRGWASIVRINGQRSITVQGDVDTRVANASQITSKVVSDFMPVLQSKYPGVSFALEGQAKEGGKTGKSMVKALLFGIVGVFVLLSFQFKSYLEPVVVIVAIPLSFVGVVAGHLVMGLDFSIVSMMGFISLAGIVVNDSILLVEFVKIGRREGLSASEAAKRASRQRFRAVLLTTLTTVAGLMPLLSERSLQAQVLIPLCTSLVFGLMASSLLVLIVVPAFYTILDDFGLTSKLDNGNSNADGKGHGTGADVCRDAEQA